VIKGGGIVQPTIAHPGVGPGGLYSLAGTGFPLPGARQYSLLARVGSGAWKYVGTGPTTITNTGPTTEQLVFRVNDNVVGNGDGEFTATYTTCANPGIPVSANQVTDLTAVHSWKCLNVSASSTAHAASVVQMTCDWRTSQQWTPRPTSDGYYELVARHSGKCLDVAYASLTHAADVVQATCVGGTNQQWRFVRTADWYYQVIARHSNMCLDVAYASRTDLARVVQGTCWGGANQKWHVGPKVN
jgi:hypothetical protein